MVITGSRIDIRDNSGVSQVRVLGVGRAYRGNKGHFGQVMMSAVRASKNHTLRKGHMTKVIVLQTKVPVARHGGSDVRFDRNAGILWNVSKASPLASRVLCPVRHEVRKYDGGSKVFAMAQMVV